MTALAATDGSDALAIALAGAIIGFAVRAAWEWWRDTRARRKRDRHVCRAVAVDLVHMRGLLTGNAERAVRENALIQGATGKWIAEPLAPLDDGFYDLVRADPPSALLDGDTMKHLGLLRSNVRYVDAVMEARERIKSTISETTNERLVAYNGMVIRRANVCIEHLDPALEVVAASGEYAKDREPKATEAGAPQGTTGQAIAAQQPRNPD